MHSLRSSSLSWFLFPLLLGRSLFSPCLLSPKRARSDHHLLHLLARFSLLLHPRTISILKNVSGREPRTSPVPTMSALSRCDRHSRDGGSVVRWVAPCGRPSSSSVEMICFISLALPLVSVRVRDALPLS